jgi:alpha-soluble NSF attachment protein
VALGDDLGGCLVTSGVQAAEGRLERELTRMSARDHFFDAGICVLASGDVVHAQHCMSEWSGKDYTFEESREGRLLAALIKAVEDCK